MQLVNFRFLLKSFRTISKIWKKRLKKISAFGKNVFVKIPITNTRGKSSVPLIERLSKKGIQINITAIFTLDQVENVLKVLQPNTHNIISVFAGRIADTGIDPLPIMEKAVTLVKQYPQADLLWASCRELLNIFQAQSVGVDIITVTSSVLSKLSFIGKKPENFSLQTVQEFSRDGKALGFTII
nr:transaldolase family protein [Oenococcus oeni]